MRIVIDANIGQSAGGPSATHAVSVACTACLQAIEQGGHSAAMSEPLRTEWREHASHHAMSWLVRMRSRRRVEAAAPPRLQRLRRNIEHHLDTNEAEAATKDVHLIELAHATDERIVSADQIARALYTGLVPHAPTVLGTIEWATPNDPACVPWILSGTPAGAFTL